MSQIETGNVNLYRQPKVANPDGTSSTVDSFSVNIDGREILLPTVTPDGRHLSQGDAIKEFERTGRHLGVFRSPDEATAYAVQLHNDYAAGRYDMMPSSSHAPPTGASLMQTSRSQAPNGDMLRQAIIANLKGSSR